MAVMIKCKMCGGDLVLGEGTVATCEYCGTTQTVPSQDNEKKLAQFQRADRLRRNCEFDKAAGVYETIVADFPEEAEAYWGLVLCKYGIEYVDDPATGKKIPTCHRSSFDPVMDDKDFEQVMDTADPVARKVYREEARQIEELRKGIIAVSAKEDPYDIFICYKETAADGERTADSVLAQDIYDALTGKGYRVFFSRITLEDKLGVAYEPYIFAALNSAKVMLAIGTDYDHFNAVWVKNEWSRYLQMMTKDSGKTLIPCYKGIDAYDLPKEFRHLQGVDLGKVGAMQDLLRGIDKLIRPAVKEQEPARGLDTEELNKSFVYNSAIQLAEKNDPKSVKEAIKKLKTIPGFWDVDSKILELQKLRKQLKRKKRVKRLVIFLIILAILASAVLALIYSSNQSTYESAEEYLAEYLYADAIRMLNRIPDFKDASDRIAQIEDMIEEQNAAYLALMRGGDPEGDYEVDFLVAGEDYNMTLRSSVTTHSYIGTYDEKTIARGAYFSYSSKFASNAQEARLKGFFDPDDIDYKSSRQLYYDCVTDEYVSLITRQNGSDPVEVFRGRQEADGSFVVYNDQGATYTLVPQKYRKDGQSVDAASMTSWADMESATDRFAAEYAGSYVNENGDWFMDLDAVSPNVCNVYIAEAGVSGECAFEMDGQTLRIGLEEFGYTEILLVKTGENEYMLESDDGNLTPFCGKCSRG